MKRKQLKWKQETKNEISLLTLDFFLKELKRSYMKSMGFCYRHYKKVRDEGYIVPESDREFQGKIRKRARKDKDYLKKVFAMQHRDCKRLVDACKNLWNRDFSKNTEAELKNHFMEVAKAHFDVSYVLFNPVPIGHLVESIIRNQLQKRTKNSKKAEEYLSILTTPERETLTGKAQKEILKIAAMKKPSNTSVRDYTVRYGWLNARFGYGDPFTIDEVKARINHLKKSNPEKSLSEICKKAEEAKEKTNEIIKELNLDGKFCEIISNAKENAFFRTYRLEMFSLAGYYATELYNEIAKRLGITYDELFYLTVNEICNALDRRDKIRGRRECLGALYDDGKVTYYTGDSISEIEEKKDVDYSKSFFRGIAPCRGKAKGRAKVIKTKKDLSKVEKGDILVAEFTTPDFVPAMEKAAAIVADLGGLTSHTAIVSREIGKPCVIGTKDASKIIMDGDIVHVDADNAVVRKSMGLKKLSTGDYKVSLIMYLFFEAFNKEQEKIVGFGHKNAVVVFNNARTKAFMDPREITELGSLVMSRLGEDPSFGERIISQHLEAGNNLLKTSKGIHGTELKRKTNRQLRQILLKFFRSFIRMSGFHIMPISLEKEIAKKVRSYLEPRVKDANDTILSITAPVKETNMVKEKKDLLEIAIMMNESGIGMDDSRVSEIIEGHKRKYEWMGVTHKYTPYTKEHFMERLAGLLEKNPEKKLEETIRKPGEIEKERKRILAKLNLPKGIMVLVDLLREFAYMRDFKRDAGYKSHYYTEKLWEEIARRAKLRAELVKNCTPYELLGFLSGKKKLDRRMLEERIRYQVLAILNGKVHLFTGKKAKEIEEAEAKEEEVKDIESFTGMPACKGKAEGIVRIVLKPEEMVKVGNGEIMVAVNTEPAMVPAMEKAAAIITEEGGITCHAAIVSRELGKPCIIGTKIATTALKDGDYVKVDAEKGIVSKVSKKSVPLNRDIIWIEELKKDDIAIAGGKGANLGEMFYHFHVPNGFCVTVSEYKRFIDRAGISAKIQRLLKKADFKHCANLDRISGEIRELILKQKFPEELRKEIMKNYRKLKNKKVAVRSSATAEDLPTASFAGQQDTYLNVKGEDDVIESVQRCWASLFTSRAIYYRQKKQFKHSDALISVVIQEMVDADFAGVIFTVDPNKRMHILIEVVRGLGEALVSGHITPNTYFVHKTSNRIIEKSENFSFSEKMIYIIANAGRKIEEHYGRPMDIEFAVRNGKIYILQARPITA